MTRNEKLTLSLTVFGILFGIVAWIFHFSNSSQVVVINSSGSNYNNHYLPQGSSAVEKEYVERYEYPTYQDKLVQPKPAEHEKLVEKLSIDAFISQMRNYLTDTSKLDYALRVNHLLSEPVAFFQLNEMVRMILSDSNKLELVQIMRGKLLRPNEEDLQELQLQFLTDRSKNKALKIIYK